MLAEFFTPLTPLLAEVLPVLAPLLPVLGFETLADLCPVDSFDRFGDPFADLCPLFVGPKVDRGDGTAGFTLAEGGSQVNRPTIPVDFDFYRAPRPGSDRHGQLGRCRDFVAIELGDDVARL